MEEFDLFDDLADINEGFKPSENKETKSKEENKIEDKVEAVTLDINKHLEKLDTTVDDEDDEEEIDEIEDTTHQEDDTETTEEEKELIDQISSLRELGALILPDDYQIESLEKALQDSEAYRNQMSISTVFNNIPNVEIPGIGNAKDLFVYLFEHQGKDIDKFKSNFGSETFDPKNYDLDEETDRRKVLELYYEKKGFSPAKSKKAVDKIFNDLEDETEAKEALDELNTISQREREIHLEQLKEDRIQREKQAQEAYNSMNQILQSKDKVGGFILGKEEKPKALNSLYNQVNYNGQPMSEFDYRLNQVTLKNPELTLALSGFLNTLSEDKNGNLYFDLSKFERAEKTKVAKSLKETVSRATAGKKRFTSSGNSEQGKKGFSWDSVVDYDAV